MFAMVSFEIKDVIGIIDVYAKVAEKVSTRVTV
jgi:hypothetical protein